MCDVLLFVSGLTHSLLFIITYYTVLALDIKLCWLQYAAMLAAVCCYAAAGASLKKIILRKKALMMMTRKIKMLLCLM